VVLVEVLQSDATTDSHIAGWVGSEPIRVLLRKYLGLCRALVALYRSSGMSKANFYEKNRVAVFRDLGWHIDAEVPRYCHTTWIWSAAQ
jgi:hypothetical protein